MYLVMYVLHVVAAVAMLVYLFMPFLVRRAASLPASAQPGAAKGIVRLNRWGQLLLVVGFLSGGYMIGKVFAGYSVVWVVLAIVLVLAVGAFSGIMGKPLKRWAAGQRSEADASKVKTMSLLAAAAYVVLMILMLYPNLG